MELKKRLGKRIQELRLKNNLKQSELAEMINIATKSQSCIETGKNYPTADNVEKYAKIFNVDVAEVLNIFHIKSRDELVSEIITLIQNADEQKIIEAYKILKEIL